MIHSWNRPEVRRRIGFPLWRQRAGPCVNHPEKHVTQTGGDRPHVRFEPLWNRALGRAHALADELARPENVGPVLEHDRDLGEAVLGE